MIVDGATFRNENLNDRTPMTLSYASGCSDTPLLGETIGDLTRQIDRPTTQLAEGLRAGQLPLGFGRR